MTRDTNKLIMDVVKAVNFMFKTETPLSLLTSMTNTPIMGIKSRVDNIIEN